MTMSGDIQTKFVKWLALSLSNFQIWNKSRKGAWGHPSFFISTDQNGFSKSNGIRMLILRSDRLNCILFLNNKCRLRYKI